VSLDVQLNGERIGELTETADRGYCFAYAPEMLTREGEGTALLSHSLPLRADPYGPEESRPYFEGLLPAGLRRLRVGAEHGIRRDDDIALLDALGRDCPGAVTFPTSAKAIAFQTMIREVKSGRPASTDWLAEAELEQQMWDVPRWRFDPMREELMLYTLPGPRRKLALVYDEAGDRWAWPGLERPSTHVIKPETDEPEDLVVNELACILACREAGVSVAHTELREIAGRRCLVSSRYDRWGEGEERQQQESFAQALGVAPGEVSAEAPSIAASCELLRSVGDPGSVETLFRAAICGLVLGSSEPPGWAFSLLHTDQGPLLAPCCGIYSTEVYERADLAPLNPAPPATPRFEGAAELPLDADSASKLPAALLPTPPPPPAPFQEALPAIVAGCGLEPQPGLARAAEIAGRLCAALDAIADKATKEGWHEPVIDSIVDLAHERRLEAARAVAG
jgi:serine/threonine-protein kinase HipA